MPSEFTIPKIIQFAQISQYLAGNDKSSLTQLRSGSFIGTLPKLLYMEGTLLQNLNSLNPGMSTLRGTAEYVLSLCGKYAIQAQNILNSISGGLATITGPSNQSILVGQSASFTIVVTSSTSYTIQWFRNGVLIPGSTGLTYTLTNAQLTDTGAQFSAVVTNGAGPISSGTGVLTVTANLLAYYYQGNNDYSAALLAGTDNVAYTGNLSITSGQPITVPFPDLGASEYIILKYPATETTKTSYLNPPPSGPDAGSIPSLALEGNSFGGWKYVFSRGGNPFGLNSVNGQVKFS
jgi:hypothetical protein